MFKYADLIGVPWKKNGRGDGGYDCYGLVLECCKRNGTPLRDVVYDNWDLRLVEENEPTLNVRRYEGEPTAGLVIAMNAKGSLHMGICLNNRTFLHATEGQGVRVSRIGIFPVMGMYEVI